MKGIMKVLVFFFLAAVFFAGCVSTAPQPQVVDTGRGPVGVALEPEKEAPLQPRIPVITAQFFDRSDGVWLGQKIRPNVFHLFELWVLEDNRPVKAELIVRHGLVQFPNSDGSEVIRSEEVVDFTQAKVGEFYVFKDGEGNLNVSKSPPPETRRSSPSALSAQFFDRSVGAWAGTRVNPRSGHTYEAWLLCGKQPIQVKLIVGQGRVRFLQYFGSQREADLPIRLFADTQIAKDIWVVKGVFDETLTIQGHPKRE